MANSKRQIQFGRMIRNELSNIFVKKVTPPKNTILSVSYVRMSADLSLANVYLSIYPSNDYIQVLDSISRITSEIRFHLSKNISKKVRHIPKLIFFYDDLMEESSRVNDILDNMD